MYTLVLLSGGKGTRMQNAVPKQYMLMAGRPVIMHILERVEMIDSISNVIIVCADEYRESIKLMVNQYGITKPIKFAPAGSSRQLSVRSGVSMVETDDVIIHEAARPFVKVEDFERLIAVKNRNVMLGTSIPFTVIKGHKTVEGVLERSELVNVQLPQKFETALLKSSLEKAVNEGREFTEDASMVFNYNHFVNIDICEGMDYNIKLTTRMDMLIGEKIYDDYFRMRE